MLYNQGTYKQKIQQAIKTLNLDSQNSLYMKYWEDTNKNIFHVSPSCERITGYTTNEFLDNSKLLKSIIFSEDIQQWEEHYELEKNQEFLTSQFRLEHKNGSIIWVEYTCQQLYDEERRSQGFRGQLRDISKEKLVADIYSTSPTVFFLWENKEGWPVSFVSDNIERLTGYTKKDFQDNKTLYSNIIYRDDFENVIEEVNYFSNQDVKEFEHKPYRIVTKSGKIKWVEDKTQIKGNSNGKIIHFQGSITDITNLKKAEEDLSKSKEKLNSILSSIKELIFIMDSKGIFLDYYQPSFENNFFVPYQEFLGKSYKDVLPQDVAELLESAISTLLVTKKNQMVDYHLELPNGKQWFSANLSMRVDSNGNLDGITAVVRNITNRKIMEESILDSKMRFQALSKATTEAIFFSEKGLCTDQNSTAEVLFGYSLSESIGMKGTDWIIPEDREFVKKQMLSEYTDPYEVTALRKDGTTFPCEIQGRTINHQNRTFRITTLRDITLQKLAEEEIRKFKTISDTSLHGNMIVDASGNITYINEYFAQQHGYTSEELIGSNLSVLHTKGQMESVKQIIESTKNSYNFGPVEIWHVHKDGAEFPTLMSGVIMKDDELNKPLFIAATAIDITHLKNIETSLKQSEEFYRSIFHNSPLGIFHFDVNGIITDCNNKHAHIIGIPREELIGRSLIKEIRDKKLKNEIEKTLRFGSGYYEDSYTSYTSLKIIPVIVHLNAIYNNKKEIVGGVALVEDISERKKIELKVLENLHHMEMINANVPNIIWKTEIDENGSFINTYISDAADEFLSLPKGSINNNFDNFFYYMIPKYASKVNEQFKKGIANPNKLVSFEYKVKKGNGKIACFSSKGRVLIENNKIIAYGSTIDITEHKIAEKALKESEEKFRILFEKSDDAILVIDNNVFVSCNQSSIDMLGYNKKEELLNMHPSKLSPEKQPDGELSFEKAERMMQIAITEGSNHFEWIHTRANGEDFPAEVWLTAIPYKERKIIHTVWRDISEQKRSEIELEQYRNHLEKMVKSKTIELMLHQENLEEKVTERTKEFQQSEERFRILTENSNDIIMRFDKKFKHLYVNPIVEKITGIGKNEFIGKTHEELGFPDDLCQLFEETLSEVLETKEKIQVEFQLPNDRWLDWTLVPELDKNNEILSIITSAHEITEMKKTERYNENLLSETQSLVDLKSNFISTVSHEFRTPISLILTSTELLESFEANWSKEKREIHFDRIKRNIDLLISMLDEVSFLENGEKTHTKKSIIDIIELGKSLIYEAKNLIKKGIEINFVSNIKSYNLTINEQLIRRILLNLLTNALKYTSNNKQVTFKIDLVLDYLVFTISDEGIGIPIKNQSTIFDKFNRGDNVGTISGTGMGLSIVKQAVESLNGVISFSSKVDAGTTFEVKIPLSITKQ